VYSPDNIRLVTKNGIEEVHEKKIRIRIHPGLRHTVLFMSFLSSPKKTEFIWQSSMNQREIGTDDRR
jgi:hypothetical protein